MIKAGLPRRDALKGVIPGQQRSTALEVRGINQPANRNRDIITVSHVTPPISKGEA